MNYLQTRGCEIKFDDVPQRMLGDKHGHRDVSLACEIPTSSEIQSHVLLRPRGTFGVYICLSRLTLLRGAWVA